MSHPAHPYNNREIHEVLWPNEPDGSFRMLKANNGLQLRFHSEYLGDHSENWILELVGEKEVRRHNTRFVETIVWIED
jgi:hypothetical protein